MKKILCPTDFSSAAHNATAYAAKLAQVTGATLVLLHVQSIFDFAPNELVGDGDDGVQSFMEALEEQSLQVGRSFKISCYAEVEKASGSLGKAIAEKGSEYDLI